MNKNGEYLEVKRKTFDKTHPQKSSLEKILKVFLHFEDELNGQETVLDFLDGLLITEDISSEVDNVAVGYMLASSLASYAEERYENLKDESKKLYGELYDKAIDGEIMGRATNAKVDAWVNRNPAFFKIQKRLNKYKRQYKILVAAAEAYEIKSRMLQTKSANVRKQEDITTETNNPKVAYDKITKQQRG